MRRVRRLLLLLGSLLLGSSFPADATTLFALVDTGEIFASENAGTTWSVRATLPVSDAVALIGGATPEELYLATERGFVYRSIDAGVDWEVVGVVPASDIVDLAGRDGALFALARSGLVWRSLDFGASFAAVASLGVSDAASLSIGPDAALYAATATGWVHRSGDGVVDWEAVGTIPVSDARTLRTRSGSLYLLSESGLVHRSTDFGATWSPFGTTSQVGMSGLAPLGGDLLAVTREGLVARSETGAAWNWVGHVNQLRVRALANDVPQVSGVPGAPGRPAPLRLTAAWPNPARAGTPVRVAADGLRADAPVTLELLDPAGRLLGVRRVAGELAGSADGIAWPTTGLASGAYFLRIRQGIHSASRRIVVID